MIRISLILMVIKVIIWIKVAMIMSVILLTLTKTK